MSIKRNEGRNVFRAIRLVFVLFWSLCSINAFADIIIDNGDPDTSFTGSWGVSGGPDPWDPADPSATSLWSRDGDTYTWTFTPTDSGYHDFSMWWTEYPSRSDSVPVTISYWGGTDTLPPIDQQQDGGQWNPLGTYPFEADVSYDITITSQPGPSSTSADAVQLVYRPGLNVLPVATIDSISPNPALTGTPVTFTGHGEDIDGEITGYRWHSSINGDFGDSAASTTSSSLSPGTHIITFTVVDDDLEDSEPVTRTLSVQDTINEIVIDNGDPETSFTGTWRVSGGADPWDPADPSATSLWSRDGDTYTWTFTPPITGIYQFSIWYTQFSSRSDSVPVSIEFLGDTDTVPINQQANGGDWNPINTYPFEAGTPYNITITSPPGPPSTCADAVKFVYLSGNTPPVATIDSITPSPALPGDSITLTGSGTDDGAISAYEWRSDLDGPLYSGDSGETFTTSTLSEGIHTIFFRVQDDEGVWSTETTAILVIHDCGSPMRIMPLGDSNTYGLALLHDPPMREYVTGYRQPLFLSLKDAGYYFNFVGGLMAGELAMPVFDSDHEGHAGWYTDEIESDVYNFLVANPADVVLLHIGTNDISDNNEDVLEVAGILNEIDRYELNFNTQVIVVLARIINREPYSSATTLFNDDVQAMAEDRIANGDKIIIVDLESALTYPDDLYDEIHPNETGFNEMADELRSALGGLLPVCGDFGPFGPFIFTSPITDATVGYPYTYNVGALGDPAPSYSLLAGPVGMSIDLATGKISWTPASGQEGVHDITVRAQNSEGTDTQDFSISVSDGTIIIDNGDPETSFTGNWRVSGGADPYDPADPSATSLWSRDGDTYTWTFTPLVSGDYEFSIWYTQVSSRSDNVPVSIEFSGGTDTVPISQQADGGDWKPINSYPFEAGVSYDITITSQPAPTSTCADAVRFVLASVIPPSITSHPSDQTVTEGQAATFSVAASGSAPLSYQWQKDGSDILDATGATYNTPATVLEDNGAMFSCVVSNTAGDATSDAATLTVNAEIAPSITSHPSGQQVPEGSTATFSVAASGSAPLSYQWQKDGSDILDATGATYTTPATVLEDNGALFRCVVSNTAGSVTSDAATLTVTAVAPSITSHPSDQTVPEGATATFSVAASGSEPLSYQWQKGVEPISGATGSTYTTPATVPGDNGALFRCVVSNTADDATSDAATLTVTAAVEPSITSHPSDQTVPEGLTATFSVACSGSEPLSYQWQKDGSDISGATDATYTTPATTVLGDNGASFRCAVSNVAGGATSDAATLTVVISEPPVAFNDKADTLVDSAVTINIVANDTDGDGTIDPASVSITSGPANGTAVEQGDGTVLYTPNAGYSGKDTFMYTVQDDQGVLSNTATVTVTVGIVIDNGDPQTSFTGAWSVSGGADPWDPSDPGATSLWSRDGDTYTWTFIPDVSGNYEVSMWYTNVSTRSDYIPVDIENWNGMDTIYINQQSNFGQWKRVGTYPFQAGVSYDITIISVPGGVEKYSTCADAVRFVHIPTNVAPIATIDSITPGSALPGDTVTFAGSGIDFEGTIVDYSWYSTLDGPLSDQATFSTSTLSEGVHSIFFKVQDNDGEWSSEIHTTVDINNSLVETTQHIFFAPGYATTNGMPVVISALQDMGATENGGVWEYTNTARNKSYIIHPIQSAQEFINCLEWPDSVCMYFGHSNYGLGQLFATQQEFDDQVIEDILYVDDDRILNSSSPVAHVNVSGMRTGQAYPHWWPINEDGSDALVPFDWGDPRGDPAYNYYVTYQIPPDPTHYKIETVHNSAIERFSDWSGPAWYDPNGGVPDPTNPDHLQYYITNSEPWSPSFERVGNWVDTNVIDEHFRENYEYSAPGTGTDQAKWLFSIPEEGDYNIYAWYPASSSNATDAPYTVNDALGSTTVPWNQRLNGGQWNSLGVFHFGVDDYSVVLTDDVSSGNVMADGIRIEHVDNPPEVLKADFNARTLSGPAPLDVYFDSENVGDVDSFLWDFGNGVQNATRSTQWVTYTEPGTYTVTYTINGPLGSDTTTEVGYITVGDAEAPLKAEFSSQTSQQGMAPYEARFRNRSSGDIVSWEWDFDGDGNVDLTQEEPSDAYFTYTEPGAYTVTLTVTDINADTDTETKENFVRIIIFDKNIDNVDYPKKHYRSKNLLYRKELEVSPEDFKYARFFYGGCDSAHYYTDTFQRGIYHYASGSTSEGEYAMAEYLKAYVDGKSDYEIWQLLQSTEPKYDYYDFNKPPSEQW